MKVERVATTFEKLTLFFLLRLEPILYLPPAPSISLTVHF